MVTGTGTGSGTGTRRNPVAGHTCGTAGGINAGDLAGGTVGGTDDWYVFNAPADGEYHVSLSAESVNDSLFYFGWKGPCGAQGGLGMWAFSAPGHACLTISLKFGDFLYLQFQGNGSYTVSVGAGACP